MLNLVLAEAALEIVPENLWSHPAVRNHSKRRDRPPNQLLLDRSLHHAAMKNLRNSEKRGRPDIIHFVLLEVLGSPLNRRGHLKVYVHTIKDYVITVDSTTRLPRNYNRFIGLIEKLFQRNRVPDEGKTLLKLDNKTLQQLLTEIGADYVLAFSRHGNPRTLQNVVPKLLTKKNPAVVIGGFPHNHFLKTTQDIVDEVVCIDPEMLDAWTVASRVIYEYECALASLSQRLQAT